MKTNTLELLEIKLKKHNWDWSKSDDPAERASGSNNFDDINRLLKKAKEENLSTEAFLLVQRYRGAR